MRVKRTKKPPFTPVKGGFGGIYTQISFWLGLLPLRLGLGPAWPGLTSAQLGLDRLRFSFARLWRGFGLALLSFEAARDQFLAAPGFPSNTNFHFWQFIFSLDN